MPESMSIKFKEIVPYSSLFIFCIHLLLKYLFAITSAAVVLLSIIVKYLTTKNKIMQFSTTRCCHTMFFCSLLQRLKLEDNFFFC